MQLIDTHTHLYLPEFDQDRTEMIARAKAHGVERFYLPNIDRGSVEPMLQMEKDFPGSCFSMMGLHPCSVDGNWENELKWIEQLLGERKYAGIGEVGLDYYWDKTHVEAQKQAFALQIEWAKELQLPVIIHSRDSLEDCIQIVGEKQDGRLKGVFHCFGGSADDAKRIGELEFFIGIGGVLTYKKSGLSETIKLVDKKQVVLETDAPYLSPVPYRGKRNEPAYLKEIVEMLASCWEMTVEEAASITTENALKLFGG
ncbi:MAG: TatD family hydrolase [Bacteroidota bacterium]